MGKIYYVDNTSGDNGYSGLSPEFAFETIDKAHDVINSYGNPGDGIRICYTGQDYTSNVSRSSLALTGAQGYGWGEGECYTYRGYNADGTEMPVISVPGGSTTGYGILFSTSANYWEISDLKFIHATENTTWSSAGIGFASGLLDSDSHFRIRRCYFDGSYSGAGHPMGIYSACSTRLHLDVQYCFFYDLQYYVRTYTVTPLPADITVNNCIFYSSIRAGNNTFNLPEDGYPSNLEFKYNTFIGVGPNQYYGYCMETQYGDFTNSHSITSQNNYCSFVNFFMRHRHLGVATPSINLDNTETVGYNTYFKLNSSTAAYVDSFDVFGTVDGNAAVGDYDLISTHTQSDYTTIFAGYSDWTYRWPELPWMLIPDLRPAGWEMTGTFEDPIEGLRGAIQYSGDYKDTSVLTTHSVYIAPYSTANFTYEILDVDIEYALRGYEELSLGLSFPLASSSRYGFSDFGEVSDFTMFLDYVSIKSGSMNVFHIPFAVLTPGPGTAEEIECITEIWHSGPSTDATVTGVGFAFGSRKLVTGVGLLPGGYEVHARAIIPKTKERTSWQLIYSYTV